MWPSWDGPQRPLCSCPGMVGVQRPLCSCPGMVGVKWPLEETLVWQSWDGGSYCGVWPQRPLCGSPGMVGVTVVCGLRYPCTCDSPGIPTCDSPGMVGVTVVCGLRDSGAAVLGWWELLWCVASETLVRQSWDGGSYCGMWPQMTVLG